MGTGKDAGSKTTVKLVIQHEGQKAHTYELEPKGTSKRFNKFSSSDSAVAEAGFYANVGIAKPKADTEKSKAGEVDS